MITVDGPNGLPDILSPMKLIPSFQEFCGFARTAGIVPVRREFLFDVDTAVTAYFKLRRAPFSFLLESVVGGEQWARYSFVGSSPSGAWRMRDGRSEWWTPAQGWELIDTEDPLADLDRRLSARIPAAVPGIPRFWGGGVGYFAYDLVRQTEQLPGGPIDDLGQPDGLLLFTDVVLAIDNLRGRAMAIAAAEVDAGMSEEELRAVYDAAAERADEVVRTLGESAGPSPLDLPDEPDSDPEFESSMTRAEYEASVERIREYIVAGDVFQAVLSQRLSMPMTADPFDVYRALRSINPSPYLYLLELDGQTLVGSSPEVLVRLEDGVVTVRPIAGTRRRGATPEEDRELAEDLLADEKELAEHRMLVDLGRNDVGRVSRFGTVKVRDLMVIERYSHVMHIVSQVEGELKEGLSAIDVLRACHPAGTVSGAPKVRAMEIIDELEPVRRGSYAGAVGYLGWGGANMDTAIAIRTILAKDGKAYVQAGAGIVADSNPSAEYEETLNKARALLRAAAMVEGLVQASSGEASEE